MADHHPLDVWPLPRDQKPMFTNEPWLIDESIYFETAKQMMAARDPEDQPDNRRVYIPLDLNKTAFLRRLVYVLSKYPDITWRNESNVRLEVCSILFQIEIYDQLWFVREATSSMGCRWCTTSRTSAMRKAWPCTTRNGVYVPSSDSVYSESCTLRACRFVILAR